MALHALLRSGRLKYHRRHSASPIEPRSLAPEVDVVKKPDGARRRKPTMEVTGGALAGRAQKAWLWSPLSRIAPFVAVAILLVVTSASAQSFSPVQCSACPTYTQVPYSYSSTEYPRDPNNGSNYINWLDNTRYVRTNKNVSAIEFYFRGGAQIETTFDWLQYGTLGGTGTNLTGTHTEGWNAFASVGTATSFQEQLYQFRFHTDASVTRTGFSIDTARVCCGNGTGSSVPQVSMQRTQRHTGILLGNNDVVYEKTGTAGSDRYINLVMWGTPGTDFDIYVRCNALPTPTVWDFRGFSGDSQEFLSWLQPSVCTNPGTWYIAINSYQGAGQFNIVTSFQYSAQRWSPRVGTNWNASATERATIANTLSQAGRQFYGQTEGQMMLSPFDLYNDTGANCGNCAGTQCNICFKKEPGPAETGNGVIVIRQDQFTEPETLAHEMGHKYLGAADEYYTDQAGNTYPACGHSNMANQFGSNNNFCYFIDNTWHDHREDRHWLAPFLSTGAVWPDFAAGLMSQNQFSTPDNFDYRTHDFNGQINVVLK